MVDGLIAPHGGELVINMASEQERVELQECAKSLPQVRVGSRQLADLEMLATGAYSPLGGFMNRADYLGVVNEMHLSNGFPWSIPITLSISSEQAATLKEGAQVALINAWGSLPAIMTINEKYGYDKQLEAIKVYRTTEETHPGVKALYQQGDVLLGGSVRVIALQQQAFARYRYTPTQSRQMFAERGWKRVVGFQTRNPVHRAHEYIQKCALETVDGLYLHPLVGATKEDDIPADIRIRCYEVLLANYYPTDRVILGVLPAAMRYAGPREAIFHALMRKNYGCSHFIVGRDHAGVGNYYGTYDAHHIFAEFDPTKLGITPMFFEHTFFCRACDSMASSKTCPHGNEQHVILSGTKVRHMLQAGEMPPREFSRPEVAKVLIEGMRQLPASTGDGSDVNHLGHCFHEEEERGALPRKEGTVSNCKRSPNLKVDAVFGVVELVIFLVILPTGAGYTCTSIFRLPVWSGTIIGLASSIILFISLIFLLGATARFPDHLFGPENDSEV